MTSEAPSNSRAMWGLFGVVVLLLIAALVWLLVGYNPFDVPEPERVTPVSVLIITGPGVGDRPVLDRPLGVTWGPRQDIYISDTGNARVCVFDRRGRFLREVGRVTTSTPAAQRSDALSQPAGLAVREDGLLFVADLRGGVVRVYDLKGKQIRALKPPASKDGAPAQRWAPTDVAVSGDEVYVADAQGVAVFDVRGALKRRYDSVGGVAFERPYSVDVASDGHVLVSDSLAQRVTSLTASGAPTWTVPRPTGTQSFALPRGVAFASDGTAFVVDAFMFGFTHLSTKGATIESYGNRGSKPGYFEFPNDVDVSDDLILVADKENDRVQVVRVRGILNATTSDTRGE